MDIAVHLRKRVQISASGHADANQSGANFFQFHLQSVLIEMELVTGQTSSSGQLTEVINSWLISDSQHLSKDICNRRSRHVTNKNYIGQRLCQQKRSKLEWLSFQCTNRLGKTNCLSPYCVLSFLNVYCLKKKKNIKLREKHLHRRFLIEDNAGNNEELLYQNVPWRKFLHGTLTMCSKLFNNAEDRRASLSKRWCTECISDFWIQNLWLKNPCWRNFKMFYPRKYGTEHCQIRHSWHCFYS